MRRIVKIAINNFKNQVRSYSFLLTLFAALFIALSFVPHTMAGYSVIKFGNYQGEYNSVWVSSLSTIMSGIFLSFFGYFLVSASIENDRVKRLGQIIAATKIKNHEYLLAKAGANFLVLSLIAILIIVTNCFQLGYYEQISDVQPWIFIKPFLIITIPTIILISSIAIALEVIVKRNILVRYGIFIFIHFFILFQNSSSQTSFLSDVFGISHITAQMEYNVQEIAPESKHNISVGYIKGQRNNQYIMEFNEISYSKRFILQRLFLIMVAFILVLCSSILFDRFKENKNRKEKNRYNAQGTDNLPLNENISFEISKIKGTFSGGIFPLVLCELKLIVRKGVQWTWGISFLLIAVSFFFSWEVVITIFVPLIFLSLAYRISDLITRENYYRTTYFSKSSYKQISRLFSSKIIAGVLMILLTISPLIIRATIQQPIIALYMINAIFMLVFISCLLGILTKSSRFFEILLLLVTYANINNIYFLDYFGGQHQSINYLLNLMCINLVVIIITITLLKLNQLKDSTFF